MTREPDPVPAAGAVGTAADREQAVRALRAALPPANLEAALRCSARLQAALPEPVELARNLVLVAYGGGKDSAYGLQRLRTDPAYAVRGILTTITEEYRRISMHGVRDTLLKAQAEALGLPLIPVPIPAECANAEYEARMGAACARLRADGVEALAFGDLFLADIRAYRERQCAAAGMTPVFPIWGEPTAELAARARERLGRGPAVLTLDVDFVDPAYCPPTGAPGGRGCGGRGGGRVPGLGGGRGGGAQEPMKSGGRPVGGGRSLGGQRVLRARF